VRVDPRVGLFIMEGDTLTRQFVEFERSAFVLLHYVQDYVYNIVMVITLYRKCRPSPTFIIDFRCRPDDKYIIIIKFLGNDRLKEVLF
jgi:hypothetical protein